VKWYKRKIVKALVYRAVSFVATFFGALAITREPVVATGAMVAIEALHMVVYIVFEFAWRPVKYRYLKPVDAFLRYFPTAVLCCPNCGQDNTFIHEDEIRKCKNCGWTL